MTTEGSKAYKEIVELPEHLYVIGDIHGCLAELKVLIDYLGKKRKLSDRDVLVFVGDYVDRGAYSRGVIDYLLQLQQEYKKIILLKGNHEDMFLNYLGFEGHLGEGFLQNGGISTLVSYGLSAADEPEKVLETLPEEHLEFLHNLDRYLIVEDFVITHAGLNPLRDMDSQVDEDLFWIRDEFINNVHSFEHLVVFGHTPHREILVHQPFKLGIDTGLVFGNKLSCVELRSGSVLQVSRGEKKVKSSKIDDFPQK